MTTEKQHIANQQNAKRSTGPRTDRGKRRSRRNALRHGLTAETVIDTLENCADYEALASRINDDYRPRNNFEIELVARLVSLLWRLRRAVAIESGLFDIQAAKLRRRNAAERADQNRLSPFYELIPALTPNLKYCDGLAVEEGKILNNARLNPAPSSLARTFKFASCESDAFERLGRYEVRLWRQTAQTILLLNSINRGTKEYSDCDDKSLHIRNLRKRSWTLWPPFNTPD